ncbi:synaptobrevin protein [Cyclospora cayetanensis]|nr:synaptobrevin protein [Cyclospora cayetanensis]
MVVSQEKIVSAAPKSLERLFKRQAREIISKYEDVASLDPTTQVIKKVESVKVVVDQSIKKVLQNQGNLEDLVSRTHNLASSAKQFNKDATAVKDATWRQKMGLTLVLGFLLAGILAYIIYALVDMMM